jgi:murein DD-endopeptidase MepM/ murein hydrolase activator NlpD
VRGPTLLGRMARDGDGGVDLGLEPPLVVGDETDDAPIRRSVSIRWLSGTILTGFTSIFLMGGALMAALSNPHQFVELPDNAETASPEVPAGIAFGQKGDRIQPIHEEVSSRQILQVSTVTKQGERDFIKLRPFAKITATLAARQSEVDSQIPAYDALRIFADTSAPEEPATGEAGAGDDQFYGANVDGEVSVKVSDFPLGTADINAADAPATDEVEAIVRASLDAGDGTTDGAALAYVDSSGDGDDVVDESDPFNALGVSIVPENVSSVVKNANEDVPVDGANEKIVAVAKGQTFRSLLKDNGVSDQNSDAIIAALSDLVDLNSMHVGQKVRLAYAADLEGSGSDPVPVRVSIYDDGAHQATVARADDNTFRRSDEPSLGMDAIAEAPTESYGTLPKLYDAVYRTALEQQVPKPLIDQLVRVFAFDVDFQARITPGDTLEVFHSLPGDDPDAAEPEILFASLTLNGVTRRFYRFRTPDDGIVDYYDEDGRSAKKFLIRKPVPDGRITSGFGYRNHPILGRRILHTGVDYAAPRGTPILAAGNGVVEKAGPNSGYGNLIVIQHTNGYETYYGHQTAFAKGIRPGVRVHQGQVIGYVGSTGLSTGPHLHFEIRVNGSPVDPLRIRLPRGRVLDNEMLASFERERQRIDDLLGNEVAPTKVASTN